MPQQKQVSSPASRHPPAGGGRTTAWWHRKKRMRLLLLGMFFLISLAFLVLYCTSWIESLSELDSTSLSEKKGGRYLPRAPFTCPLVGGNNRNASCHHHQQKQDQPPGEKTTSCPDYFRWIHEDLRPWRKTGITRRMVERAGRTANFRLLVVDGKMYVESYSTPFQTRDTFNWWGLVQLLRRYSGRLPDLDLMFDCDDIPIVQAADFYPNTKLPPPPLFSYCKDDATLNIPFPDWSFWGWSEVNIKPWVILAKEQGDANERLKWEDRVPYAFWKGNPDVSPERGDLLRCNLSLDHDWNARLFSQDWASENNEGFQHSNLANQCTYRYKIYVEGRSWSVSQKYILACNSLSLLVTPKFDEFFTRGLIPLEHYWPIKRETKCSSIKFAVDWGNLNPKQAQAIGRNAGNFIREELKMDNVYDYMFHLLNEYSKLLRYRPRIPPNAVEVCSDSMLCTAPQGREKQFMMDSQVDASKVSVPCSLSPAFAAEEIRDMLRRKDDLIKLVQRWEDG